VFQVRGEVVGGIKAGRFFPEGVIREEEKNDPRTLGKTKAVRGGFGAIRSR